MKNIDFIDLSIAVLMLTNLDFVITWNDLLCGLFICFETGAPWDVYESKDQRISIFCLWWRGTKKDASQSLCGSLYFMQQFHI